MAASAGTSTSPDGQHVDGVLVARSLDGDASSYAVLFRRHAPGVHTFAQRRTRSVDLADDVVSAAFEKGWSGLDQLGARHGDRFRPWIFRIAANEMASMMRAATRRQHREHLAAVRGEIPSDGDRPGSALDPTAAVDNATETEEMLDALGRLADRHQELISLRYLSDLTAAETATALGITRGNVAVSLHRAVAALRREMEVTA